MMVNVSGLGTAEYPMDSSSFSLSHEDADDKDVGRIKGAASQVRLTWKFMVCMRVVFCGV